MGEVSADWRPHSAFEQRLQQLVLGLTYEEGWTFRLDRWVGGQSAVVVTWELPDVDDPRARTTITAAIVLKPDHGDDALRRFLFEVWETIGRFEAHERLEQLRFDGRTIWDPHPPGSRGQTLVCGPDFSAPLPLLEGVPA